MNATAIALARNDADIIEAFVRHHLTYVDLLVVVDNASFDGTREILEALRQEGLPLMIVDDPTHSADESDQLTRLYRRVAPVFNPELVYLLEADQFIRAQDRATLEAELSGLPLGATAALRRQHYIPDAITAAKSVLADPLALIVNRSGAQDQEECPLVLRRDPADDDRLVIAGIGQPMRRGDETLPGYLAEGATLACMPARCTEQLTA